MSTTTEPGAAVPTPNTARALLTAVGLLAIAAAGSYAIPAGFVALYAAADGATLLVTTVGGVVATLFLAVLGAAYRRLHHVEIPLRRPAGGEWAWIAGGLALSLALAVAFAVLEGLLAAEAAVSSASLVAGGASALTVALAAGYFLLVVGPVEEYLFRGVVQGRLRQSFGPVAAIGVTSVGFALGHAPNYWLAGSELLSVGVAVALAGTAVAAAVLGVVYERTANLVVVALVHGLTNAVLFGLVVALAG